MLRKNIQVVSSEEALKKVKKVLGDENNVVAIEFTDEYGEKAKFILSNEAKNLLKAYYLNC